MNDLIADTISRINVALISRRTQVTVCRSNLVLEVLKCLLRSHYISGYSLPNNPFCAIVHLRYEHNKSMVTKIRIVSTRRHRITLKLSDFVNPKIKFKNSDLILSTDRGVLSKREAFKKKAGGLVLLEIT